MEKGLPQLHRLLLHCSKHGAVRANCCGRGATLAHLLPLLVLPAQCLPFGWAQSCHRVSTMLLLQQV